MQLGLLRSVVIALLYLLLAGMLYPTPVSYASDVFNLTPTDEPTRPPATSAPTDPPATSAPTNPPATSAPTDPSVIEPSATSAPQPSVTRPPRRDNDDDDDDDEQTPVTSTQIPVVPMQRGTPLATAIPTPEPTSAATPLVPTPEPTSAATPLVPESSTVLPPTITNPPPPVASTTYPQSLPRTGGSQGTSPELALPLLLLGCIAIGISIALRQRGAR